MVPIRLSADDARRACIVGALLAEPKPVSLLQTIQMLGGVQMDPVSAVARAERLVLWSRLGSYDATELDRALFVDRSLFEYWAFIVPMVDYAIHRETMRRFPRMDDSRGRMTREWLAANASFRRYVLREMRRRGALRSRELEDRSSVPWRSGGWNDGKNLGRMLELLWFGGRIATVGREGGVRIWDLAERILPTDQPRLPAGEVARRLAERQLRLAGIARSRTVGLAFDGRPPVWEGAQRALQRDGIALPVTIDGLPGEWLAHRDVLETKFVGRTTLLSPFDRLIHDRARTEQLFGFRYRLEMYVPRAKREYGYYVLPILHGDRLIGRIDPLYDRRARVLKLNGVYGEPNAPAAAGRQIARSVADLAAWLGAARIDLGPEIHARWRAALMAVA